MKLNRIKDVLEDKGISQTWLAKKLDKSFNTVNSYVCNRSQPNLETLLQISKILDVDMKDLIKKNIRSTLKTNQHTTNDDLIRISTILKSLIITLQMMKLNLQTFNALKL